MKKSFNVFGKHVPIVRTRNLANDTGALGLFHRDKFFIEIDHKLHGKNQNLTLCHELIHAVIQRAGAYQAGLSEDLEEILCEQISVAICENFDLK
jgi:Zn-dependent peptidase ImmA (M78 family)